MNEHEWEELKEELLVCYNLCEKMREICNSGKLYETTIISYGQQLRIINRGFHDSLTLLMEKIAMLKPVISLSNPSIANKLVENPKEYFHPNGELNSFRFGSVVQIVGILNENFDLFFSCDINININKKLFISHSSEDKPSVELFVKLLKELGFKRENMFCSSVIGFDIPTGSGDIYEFLRNEFNSNDLFVIYILSDNYYKSPACLNEMGASWVKSCNDQAILLPDFEYNSIKGTVNPRNDALKLNDKYKLTEFKGILEKHFDLPKIEDVVWQKAQDEYLESLGKL